MSFESYPNSMRGLASPATSGGRVSILMRTLDRPILLARALSSVLSQSYSDWELSLVNDGGAPGPVDALVAEYSAAFAGRIRVRHHARSLGMEAASNAALDGATGDFVCVHDDDDSWHPDFLAATTQFLRDPAHARFAAVVTHNVFIYERLEEDGVVEERREPDVRAPPHVDYADMLNQNQFPPISLMIRRAVVDAIGPFNADLPVLGDWDYNLRIMQVGDIGVLPARLSFYHHRRADEATSYGNSVISAVRRHDEARTLYRNSMMRRLGETSPASLGLVHVLLREAGQNQGALLDKVDGVRRSLLERSYDTDTWNGWRHTDLQQRLHRVEDELAELRHDLGAIREAVDTLGAALRPLRAVWRRMLPVRRTVARLRGRP